MFPNRPLFFLISWRCVMLTVLGIFDTIHFLQVVFSGAPHNKAKILYRSYLFINVSVFPLITNVPRPLDLKPSFTPHRRLLLSQKSPLLLSKILTNTTIGVLRLMWFLVTECMKFAHLTFHKLNTIHLKKIDRLFIPYINAIFLLSPSFDL